VIVDVHGHALDLAFRSAAPLNAPLGGTTDIPLLRAGGVTVQLCPTWTPDVAQSGPHSHSVEAPRQTLLRMLEYLHQELALPTGADVLLAQTTGDLYQAESDGRVALIVGMEGTDALEGDPAVLGDLYRLGLRHVGLVHEHVNEFGGASQIWEAGKMRAYDPATDAAGHLSSRGRDLLAEMRRLGVLVDLTHLVEPGFWEVLDALASPAIVSHGGARGLAGSTRYLSDDQLRAIASGGGVVGASPTPLGPSAESPGLPLLLDSLDYLVGLIGADHVAVGTDFKDQTGCYPPPFADSSQTSVLLRALSERGYDDVAISQICGGSFLRLFAQVVG
jgi:membrane dipeptidase